MGALVGGRPCVRPPFGAGPPAAGVRQEAAGASAVARGAAPAGGVCGVGVVRVGEPRLTEGAAGVAGLAAAWAGVARRPPYPPLPRAGVVAGRAPRRAAPRVGSEADGVGGVVADNRPRPPPDGPFGAALAAAKAPRRDGGRAGAVGGVPAGAADLPGPEKVVADVADPEVTTGQRAPKGTTADPLRHPTQPGAREVTELGKCVTAC